MKLAVGLIVGFALGVSASYLYLSGGGAGGQVYAVRSIASHYPHKDQDSETTLMVYREGDSGHVKEVLCLFPPDLTLSKDSSGNWTGIRKVRVGPVGQKYMLGEVGYICEVVQ